LDPAPRVSELCSVPAALDELVRQMLEKEPSARPASATEVMSALAAIRWSAADRVAPRRVAPSLTLAERRVLSLIATSTPDPDALSR
ncbi:hypothetical protein C1Y08_30630, partial [Pseudomonas sp. FW306-02-F02-AA]|uniref:hypothetical protein n=1 Tax=Pseudomonas sp. FW306-02-F02-AA TaxID=2070652 RepID=UPI000CB9BB28